MFSQSFSRTILCAVFAATLLVPAAHADSWARDSRAGIDPAIATTIHDRATLTPEPALDPAIRTALLERATPPIRPDDRAGMRSVGSLPQPERATASETFDWNVVGIGAGATFVALLLAFGSLIAVRRGRAHVTSA